MTTTTDNPKENGAVEMPVSTTPVIPRDSSIHIVTAPAGCVNPARKFRSLFTSREAASAFGTPTGEVDAAGKVLYNYTTLRRDYTEDDIAQHLAGNTSIVAIAIREDNTCCWASIDDDDYLRDTSKIRQRIDALKLPLHIFTSKSGGLHLMAFFREPKPAKAVRRLLAMCCEMIGIGKNELFPKQDIVAAEDAGNGMNLPFFGDAQGLADFEPTYCDIPVEDWPKEWPKGWERVVSEAKGVKLKAGWDPEEKLAEAGLLFSKRDLDNGAYSLDYYADHGECLLWEGAHDGAPIPTDGEGTASLARMSCFLVQPKDGTLYLSHQCFDSDCRDTIGKTPKALARLGINVDDIAAPTPQATVGSKAAPLKFEASKVEGGDDDYVLGPLPEQAGDPVPEGQFPLGEVSLIGGTSGAGKSTILYDAAVSQERGEVRYRRPTYRRRSTIILRDRGDRDVRLTFRRLGLDQNSVDYHVLKGADRNRPVGEVLGKILDEREPERRPQLIVIEGLDLGVDGTAVKMEDVVPVMDALQVVARHFHVAIVGTVGSPKMKVGEDFVNERERLFGSGAWGRMAASVWILTAAGKDAERVKLVMLGRHSKRQEVTLEWQRGKLVEVAEEQLEREEDKTMLEWVCEQEKFTKAEFKRAIKASGSTVNKKLDGLKHSGLVAERYHKGSVFYEVKRAEVGIEA